MIVNEGDTVRLPCIVDRLEGFVMLWKRGQEIITVANQIIDKVSQTASTAGGQGQSQTVSERSHTRNHSDIDTKIVGEDLIE